MMTNKVGFLQQGCSVPEQLKGRMGENDQGAVRSGSGSDVTVPKAMSKSHYARGLKRKAVTELRAQKRETNRYSSLVNRKSL